MQKKIKSFDGTRICYDISKGDSKSCLVFVHGIGGNLTAWKKERRFFHSRSYSTLAIDLRGHGKSERPKSSLSYNLEYFAKDIRQVIKREKISNFILIGHCFGAIISMIFHKLYPSLARSYIFIDTTYKAPTIVNWVMGGHKFYISLLNNLLGREDLTNKCFSHLDYGAYTNTGDWSIRRLFSDIKSTSIKSWVFTYENLAGFYGNLILKNMKQKVLIIHGDKDSYFNFLNAEKMHHLVKNSKLRIVPDANHVSVLNNPQIIEKEIYNFINQAENKRYARY